MDIITTPLQLETLCQTLTSLPPEERRLGIDTEFVRTKTYWPQLCLIQLAFCEEVAIIDPLPQSLDLSPLYKIISDPSYLKILFAPRQDLEIFLHQTGTIPQPLFDIQMSSLFDGFKDLVGYHKIVKHYLDIDLDKSSQFTDWKKRPLSEKQLVYAANDSRYLLTLYDKITENLREKKTLSWAEEEMEHFGSPALYLTQEDEMWRRLPFRNTESEYLNFLKHLCAFREREAKAKDLVRSKFLKDEVIQEIALEAPKNIGDLKNIKVFSHFTKSEGLSRRLLCVLDQARKVPSSEWPKIKRKPGNLEGMRHQERRIKALLKEKCEAYDLPSSLVMTSAEISTLALQNSQENRVFKGWRNEVLGKALVDITT